MNAYVRIAQALRHSILEPRDQASPTRSISGSLSSLGMNDTVSALSTGHKTFISRSSSQNNRKVSALPALQYTRPNDVNVSFLVDRSQRPPGKKAPTTIPTMPAYSVEVPLRTPQFEPLSPSLTNTELSTVSTPREEALARLIGLEQVANTPSPSPVFETSSVDGTSSLPKIRISTYRRSRSEHTLNTAGFSDLPADLGAQRRRSVHEAPKGKQPVDLDSSWGAASDTSTDNSDDEETSMWWKSVSSLSPRPFHRPDQPLSPTIMKQQSPLLVSSGGLPHSPTSPSWNTVHSDRSKSDSEVPQKVPVIHTHHRNVSIIHGMQQSRSKNAAM